MWEDDYNAFTNYEKGEFRRLANYILSHAFIVKEKYDMSKKMIFPNNDYRLMERLFVVMKEYFEIIGWVLIKDSEYNVISIHSEFDNNRMRMNSFSTFFLYALRLIYEEEREKPNNYLNVRTETSIVVEKMRALGLVQKSSAKEREEAQKILSHFNIIQKIESKWEADGNHLIIFPSILSVITNQGINEMAEEIAEIVGKTDTEYDENEVY